MKQSTPSACGGRCGFSLIELVVIVAIIMILAMMLMPNFRSARHSVDRVNCATRQRECINGLLLYAGDNQQFLPPVGHHRNWRGLGYEEWWMYRRWVGAYVNILTTNQFEIAQCPSVRRSNIMLAGIGYNHQQLGIWLGPATQERVVGNQPQLFNIRAPADTVVFADSAWITNPSATNPAAWYSLGNADHLFRTPDNPQYASSPQRAYNRHQDRLVAAFADGHVSVLSVTNLGFQYPLNHPLAKWDL